MSMACVCGARGEQSCWLDVDGLDLPSGPLSRWRSDGVQLEERSGLVRAFPPPPGICFHFFPPCSAAPPFPDLVVLQQPPAKPCPLVIFVLGCILSFRPRDQAGT
jgi:hypothetical protein